MANNTYHGIYMNHWDIAEFLKRPVYRLTDRCAARIRGAALKMGIPKNEQKQKLRFYILDEQEVAKLANPHNSFVTNIKFNSECRPVISIKGNDIDSVYNRINPFYPKNMDPITHTQYKDDLEDNFKQHITKL